MNPPSTIAELLVSQFAPAVLLTLKQVSQVTGQAEQTIRNLISQNRRSLPNPTSRPANGARMPVSAMAFAARTRWVCDAASLDIASASSVSAQEPCPGGRSAVSWPFNFLVEGNPPRVPCA